MFYADLKKHATEIINCKKKEMFLLRDDEIESYKNKKFYIFKKFHDADDSNNDSEDDTYVDNDGDEDLMSENFMVILQDVMI